ncbi:hypothetical protein PVAND_005821 [Polypedilum vanderplanki]|uniref:Uncharacterized protein n=1 Tax=Polypedilum vanderplanki TaxID=319348 RepID=A0A9J6C269_POLVA|nr:hypothetical protein PVAND_005821 [Polypedilum vanderplanki]
MARQCLNQGFFCISLETSGFIIAWMNIIPGIIGSIGFPFLIITRIIVLSQATDLEENVKTVHLFKIVIYCFGTIISIVNIVSGYFLINGINKKNHRKMRMILVLLGIGIFLEFVFLFESSTGTEIIKEIGGYVIGFAFMILSFIGMTFSIIMMKISIDIHNEEKRTYDSFSGFSLIGFDDEIQIDLSTQIFLFSFLMAFSLICGVSGISLVIGTNQRDYRPITLMLILLAFNILISFAGLIHSKTLESIAFCCLIIFIQTYFLLCIQSLYVKIKNEEATYVTND